MDDQRSRNLEKKIEIEKALIVPLTWNGSLCVCADTWETGDSTWSPLWLRTQKSLPTGTALISTCAFSINMDEIDREHFLHRDVSTQFSHMGCKKYKKWHQQILVMQQEILILRFMKLTKYPFLLSKKVFYYQTYLNVSWVALIAFFTAVLW